MSDSVILQSSDEADLYYVFYQGKTIMSYNSKNDHNITWMEVLSPLFHLENGIRVGGNITNVIADFKTDSLNQNENIEKDTETGYYYYIMEEDDTSSILLFFDKGGTILWIGLYEEN